MNDVKMGALYIRVSTDKQEDLSPDAQKRLLLDYAQKNNIIINQDFVFIENGISGKKVKNRPEFQKMISISKSKEHPIDIILVWKFSRFARNQEESIVYKSMLKRDNIEVISVSEPLVDGPFGSLIERIIEWMDEYYSIRLSGEVIRGMTENAMRGNHQGRAPFGYNLENEKLVINQENSPYIKLIFENYAYKNMSFYGIANQLSDMGVRTLNGNLFYSRSVKYILSNPIYKGYILWNVPLLQRSKRTKLLSEDIIYRKGHHEAIVTEELFELAQKRLLKEYEPKAKPPESQRHWLSGIIRCSTCGCTLVSAGSNGGFQCGGYLKRRCKKSHYVKMHRMERIVLETIKEISENKDMQISYTNKIIDASSSDVKMLKDRLNKTTEKLERIKTAYQNGVDTLEEYKSNKSVILKEQEELKSKLESKKSNLNNPDNKIRNQINNVYDIVSSPNFTKDDKRNAIGSIVSKIIYDKETEHIDIYFHYS